MNTANWNLRCMLTLLLLLNFVSTAEASDLERIRLLHKAGDFETCVTILDSMCSKDTEDDSVYFYFGRAHLFNSAPKKAVKAFQKAIKLEESSSLYHYWLGRARAAQAPEAIILKAPGLIKKARKSWNKATELDPSNWDAHLGLLMFYSQAPGIAGGGMDKAEIKLAEIEALDQTQGYLAAAMLAAVKEEYPESIVNYKRYQASEPDDSSAAFSLAMVYQGAGMWEEAIIAFESIIEDHPLWPSAWYQLGRTGVLSGQSLQRATAAYLHYLQMSLSWEDPSYAHAHNRLGNVYQLKGELDSAKIQYQAAIELDPKIDAARDSLKALENYNNQQVHEED